MKRKKPRDGANTAVTAEREPVSNHYATWLIYKALQQFYTRHEQEDLPDHASLKSAAFEVTVGDNPIWLRHDMKRTPEEERKFLRWALSPRYDGEVLEVDEIIRMLRRNREFDADIQTLIDLVDAVLKEAGSRVDWDWRPDSWLRYLDTHSEEDQYNWPDSK